MGCCKRIKSFQGYRGFGRSRGQELRDFRVEMLLGFGPQRGLGLRFLRLRVGVCDFWGGRGYD